MNIAVILAGGKGLRFGSEIPKQMLILGNKHVISWSVDTFHKSDLIDQIIIVSEKNLITEIRMLFPETRYPKILSVIEGGAERSDSSYNALISAEFKDNDIFLFHDAARPFVTELLITDIIKAVKASGACGTYVQSTDTVALVENSIVKTIPERKSVFSAQTPQGFRYGIIKRAHQLKKDQKTVTITDDVSLVFNMGIDVSVVRGSYENIKITTETDFRFAEFIISGGNKC